MTSQAEIKSLLRYDPEAGAFYWLNSGRGRHIGVEAGSVNPQGYRQIAVNGQSHQAHRLAVLYMTGELPPADVDHINGQRGDNRWTNLRCATRSENMQNQRRVRGISPAKTAGKWLARIGLNGKLSHLGTFATRDEALAARRQAERALHAFAPVSESM